jgi:soluble lytic murein transglycosylase-like protein
LPCNPASTLFVRSRAGVLALVLSIGLPAAADAQIQVWRDAAGNLVMSGKSQTSSGVMPAPAVSREGSVQARLSERAARFDALIKENAEAHGVNPHLVRAVIQQESAFNPNARSHKGAMGLMQLMPATAAELGVSDPFDPSENIRGGVAYLKGLLQKFSQNVELALAAYNAGPTAVTKYGAVPPYRETQDYVSRITTAIDAVPRPKRIFKTIEIVNGREIPRYSTIEAPGAEPVGTPAR